MGTLDERVAYLEGQMAEQSHTFIAIRDVLKSLDQRVDRVEQRIDRLEQRMEAGFEAIDRRFEAVDRRFEAIDRRFEGIEGRIAGIEDKMSRQFVWLVGIQITILIAVVGAVLSRG